jgi:hypothetical protein
VKQETDKSEEVLSLKKKQTERANREVATRSWEPLAVEVQKNNENSLS